MDKTKLESNFGIGSLGLKLSRKKILKNKNNKN
jgi:hypothetical protein